MATPVARADVAAVCLTACAGAVFLPSMLEALCCQAFFNPDIIRILRLILYAHEADYNQVQEEEDWMDAQERGSPTAAAGSSAAEKMWGREENHAPEHEGLTSPISKAEAMRSCAIVTQVSRIANMSHLHLTTACLQGKG